MKVLSTTPGNGNIVPLLVYALSILTTDAHSWIENVESIYCEGASRVGMDNNSDVSCCLRSSCTNFFWDVRNRSASHPLSFLFILPINNSHRSRVICKDTSALP
mmetsp:Transcript_21621/g.40755  ORF Transcript_21621/g.40755 Transcript_21621/m.40755 type:complete len:104 (-) Transcript_21621:1828-2139(-)